MSGDRLVGCGSAGGARPAPHAGRTMSEPTCAAQTPSSRLLSARSTPRYGIAGGGAVRGGLGEGEDVPVTGQRVVRRALGRRLTLLRAATGKSRREVAEARLGISEPTLHRIETGKVPVTVANVRALCWLYQADGSVTDALAELALGTSQEEWWDASPAIPDWFKLYVGLEAGATRISVYDGELVPGELQLEAYTRSVFKAEQPADTEVADRQVALRMQRQQTL